MKDLSTLDAHEARTQIVAGQMRVTDLIKGCLDRIRKRDEAILAWAHINPDYALHEARLRDEALEKGQKPGVLHGIPIGIKDVIDTKDYLTECGTEVFKGRRPQKDADIVRLLKSEGAIILGKTVTCELAFYSPGKTRNPFDLERTPGGSSSGSAAAVADYHVPLAVGTQTAGSILRPASYCGVIGFKPTYGRMSLSGALEQSPPLDTLGCFARSIEDTRLFMSVFMKMDPPQKTIQKTLMRLAFVKTDCWHLGDKEMQHTFMGLVDKHSGLIEEVCLPDSFINFNKFQKQIQFCDIARNYGPIADKHAAHISQKLVEVINEGRSVRETEYKEACSQREPLYKDLEPLLNRYDAILTPAAPGIAPKGLSSTGMPIFNFLWTYLGCPAISLPLLQINDLPMGVQLVGVRGGDQKLLEIAHQVTKLLSD